MSVHFRGETILNTQVVVCGVGALGSHFVQFARNFGGEIVIVDDDRVERKNVASQFHAKVSVGRGKTQSLAQSMDFLFGKKLTSVSHRLTVDNADKLLERAALVVDCFDNGASRRVVQETARRLGLPCLHGALAADGAYGRVVWDERFVVDDESAAGAPTCEGGEHLPFVAVVSAYLARAAQSFLVRGAKTGYEVTTAGAVAT